MLSSQPLAWPTILSSLRGSAPVRDRFNALSAEDQERVLSRLDERRRQRSGIPRRALRMLR